MIKHSDLNKLYDFNHSQTWHKACIIYELRGKILMETWQQKPNAKITNRETREGQVNLEKVYQKNGVYDGKLFFSADKATYTFLFDNEVIVLHLDLPRKVLFLKGHKVQSMNQHAKLALFLDRFRQCLQENIETEPFVEIYDTIIAELT